MILYMVLLAGVAIAWLLVSLLVGALLYAHGEREAEANPA